MLLLKTDYLPYMIVILVIGFMGMRNAVNC